MPHLPGRRGVPRRAHGGGRGASPRRGVLDGQAARGRSRPAPGERSIRSQVLHARDDGHRPEPGPQRPQRGGPGQADLERPVRVGRLPKVRPDVRQDRAGHRGRPVRGEARRGEGGQGAGGEGHRPRLRGSQNADGRVQGDRSAGDRAGLPPGAEPAAREGHRGGVPVVERQAGRRLPPPEQDQRLAGDRRQHRGHGLRQHGRGQRDRRGVHPRPRHRGEGSLRRLPSQRPGGRRRGRHPQHAEVDRAGPAGSAVLGGAPGRHGHPGAPLSRHVRHRVHHRARQAVVPPDQGGQADLLGRMGDGVRHAAGGPDLRGRGVAAPGSEPVGPALQAGDQGGTGRRSRHPGTERVSRRGGGAGRVHGRRRRGVGRAGGARHPVPARDHTRRLSRDDQVAGHPDQRRRDELARRGGGPRRGHPRGVRRRCHTPGARGPGLLGGVSSG